MSPPPRRVNPRGRRYDVDDAQTGRSDRPGILSAVQNRRRRSLSPTENAARLVIRDPRGLPSAHPVAVDIAADASELCSPRERRRRTHGYPVPAPVLATPCHRLVTPRPVRRRRRAKRRRRRRDRRAWHRRRRPAGAGDGRTGGGKREDGRCRGVGPRRGRGGAVI